MSHIQEAKLLHKLQRQIEAQPSFQFSGVLISVVLWLALAVYFFLLLRLDGGFMLFVVAAASILFGIVIATAAFRGLAAKQWSFIKPHINQETVASRLRELESQC
ncbi:MAG: hypothetical protein H4O13_05380 [Xanthomonadales bacterium]|nr:hypothetical protein [Xanthomonadales bacterium]